MGLCQPLLFAHARQFFPEHLLGRGMTFANFLTIGGSGLVQWATGIYVARLHAAALPAPDVYAALHAVYGRTHRRGHRGLSPGAAIERPTHRGERRWRIKSPIRCSIFFWSRPCRSAPPR